jgi:hypothetical protein
MLHHVSFGVADLARSAAFYDATLSALGYVRAWMDKTAIGYGLPGGVMFAIKLRSAGSWCQARGSTSRLRRALIVTRFTPAQHGGGYGAPGPRPCY